MSHAELPLAPRLWAEGLGTLGLLAVVVGSGIMAERLAGGNEALALLANSLATGAGLFALCFTFGPVSGAHFNPAVTLSSWAARSISARVAGGFVVVQIVGALAGVLIAHAIFQEPLLQVSMKARSGPALAGSEFIATAGLLLVVRAGQRNPAAGAGTAAAVACYITAAYWFTSSTSFANPAVTLARTLTDTFTGIRPSDAPGFWGGQLLAIGFVRAVERLLWPEKTCPV